ncbi:MAG: hypothetical protein ABWY55_09735 [Microbacterium sp.]
MRFLLIAPGSAVAGLEAIRNGDESRAKALESQFDHRTRFLTHTYRAVTPPPAESFGRLSVSVHDVRVHVALGHSVLVADLDVDLDPSAPAVELESALTGVAARLAAETRDPGLDGIRWVGRYRILDDEAAVVPGWAGAEAQRIALRDNGSASLVAGWANGTIDGWRALDPGERWDVVHGLVDAQVLWCQIEDIHEASRDELRELYLLPGRTRLAPKVAALTDVNAWMQVHNLCVGEVVIGIQGRRRDVALGTLEVWRYDALREKTGADIDAALEHTAALQRLRSQRYQRAVEVVLLALTLVSTFGLVLSFISVAFINVTTSLPDEGSVDVPLLSWFREWDADAVLLASALGIVVVVLALLLARRRSAPGVGR